jgi:hypothetical protein
VLDFMFPERVARRLILRVTDLLDAADLPLSVHAGNAMTDRIDAIGEADGYTGLAKDSARYATYAGYAVRLIEEADGKARALDRSLAAQLEQVRAAAPTERRRRLEEFIADPETSDHERQLFQRWLGRDDQSLEFEHGAHAVVEALVDDSVESGWIDDDRRFLKLSGHRPDVWRIFVLKLTEAVNGQLRDEEDRNFSWDAIEQFARYGYLLRVGDALNEERFVPPTPT